MPSYHALGKIPPKRHTQFRKPDGGLYSEELFGEEGFSGCRVAAVSPVSAHARQQDRALRRGLPGRVAAGDASPPPSEDGAARRWRRSRRRAQDADVQRRLRHLASSRPTEPMDYFYRNAMGDELLFVHYGSGMIETTFGTLPYHEGDYALIPRGTTWRVRAERASSACSSLRRSAARSRRRKRYRNEFGQLLEHSPFCDRDLRRRQELPHPRGARRVRGAHQGQ